jgi:hypothetical protein
MHNITVRDARGDEAASIVQMIREMVTDMAGYGATLQRQTMPRGKK